MEPFAFLGTVLDQTLDFVGWYIATAYDTCGATGQLLFVFAYVSAQLYLHGTLTFILRFA
jgi:hypothetical protein